VDGAVSVVGSDDQPTLEVSELAGAPLQVSHQGGALVVDYERPWRPGPLAWLAGRGHRRRAVLSLAVPRDCRVELRAVSASLMVGGLHAPVQAKTVSGEVTLARLRGRVEAESVSGPVQASGVTGDLSARTVSGNLTVVEGGGDSRSSSSRPAARWPAPSSSWSTSMPRAGTRPGGGSGPAAAGSGPPAPPATSPCSAAPPRPACEPEGFGEPHNGPAGSGSVPRRAMGPGEPKGVPR
jgi:hypothetical protein